jgi:putative DNA primase/helicase
MLPSEFYDLEVVPALRDGCAHAYPEFGFKKHAKGWVATVDPGVFGVRPDRILVHRNSPYYISIAEEPGNGLGMTFVQYENGGQQPKGQQYIEIVKRIADKLGIDSSILDAKELTPKQRREIEERRDEMAKQAEMRAREDEKQEATDRARDIENARKLIKKAIGYGDRSNAEAYFRGRGRKIEDLPGGELPQSIQYTPDCGFKSMTRAVIGITQDERCEFVGGQRIFVDNIGRPIEVDINGSVTRKATFGRPFGAICVLGEPKPGEPIVLCEGLETGVAIHEATGWCVCPCISAGGLRAVSLVALQSMLAITGSIVIIAGDLDRAKLNLHGVQVGLTGQRACVYAADRIRSELAVMVAELLPSHADLPELVGDDEQPLEGKSVDWEDAINTDIDRVRLIFQAGIGKATLDLTEPGLSEKPKDEQRGSEEDAADKDAAEEQAPVDTRKFKPYADVYPKNQLDAAHEFLLEHYAPKVIEREGGGLKLALFSGLIHIHKDGHWVPIDAKPLDIIRPQVQRHFHKHCKATATKETPPRFYYVDANLSKSENESVAQAAIDEVAITLPQNDFRSQFWLRANIDNDGDIVYDPMRDRVIWRPQDEDPPLPDAETVIPTINGLINLEAWRKSGEMIVMPSTPLLFNLGRIEASIPAKEVNDVMKGTLDELEEYAWNMCPEWYEFLTQCFEHKDERVMHGVIRELHKVLGNWIAGDLGHHKGNIVWLIGPPGSGKSVLLQVVQALIGKSNFVSSTMAQLDSDFHLNSWIGKKLAIFPDMDFGRQDKRSVVERIKLISTGDEVSINRKYLSEIPAHRLGTRIAIAANNIPSIPDATQAIARRSLAFEMRNTIAIEDQDAGLADRLKKPSSLTGILLLALIGIKRIDQDKGFRQPECYQSLIEDLKDQSSDYKGFIDDYLIVSNDEKDTATERDLWALWSKYREEQGVLSQPKIKQFMSQLKTCLTGIDYRWRRTDVETDPSTHAKFYRGFKISERGMELVTQASGAAAGGHDSVLATC